MMLGAGGELVGAAGLPPPRAGLWPAQSERRGDVGKGRPLDASIDGALGRFAAENRTLTAVRGAPRTGAG
jgi:hypothetical protein